MTDEATKAATPMSETDPIRARFLAAKEHFERLTDEKRRVEKPIRDRARAERAAATQYLQADLEAAEAEYEEALDAAPEYVGICETCGTPLFEGDKGFKYADDAIYLCADHAPTYGDCLHSWLEAGPDADDDGEEAWQERIDALKSHDPNETAAYTL